MHLDLIQLLVVTDNWLTIEAESTVFMYCVSVGCSILPVLGSL